MTIGSLFDRLATFRFCLFIFDIRFLAVTFNLPFSQLTLFRLKSPLVLLTGTIPA